MRDNGGVSASFADIAVSLTVLLGRSRFDLADTMVFARSIGLTEMAMGVVMDERERDIANLEELLQILKKMSEVEPQVRAVIERKAKRRWTDFARAAVL